MALSFAMKRQLVDALHNPQAGHEDTVFEYLGAAYTQGTKFNYQQVMHALIRRKLLAKREVRHKTTHGVDRFSMEFCLTVAGMLAAKEIAWPAPMYAIGDRLLNTHKAWRQFRYGTVWRRAAARDVGCWNYIVKNVVKDDGEKYGSFTVFGGQHVKLSLVSA